METAIDTGSSLRHPYTRRILVFSTFGCIQLLKKHGWKEGTGLGVSEQGRLEPIQASIKKNKRGLGAENPKKAVKQSKISDEDNSELPKDKPKRVSKKMRKVQEFEKRIEETEFDRAFFRMFWPDNV